MRQLGQLAGAGRCASLEPRANRILVYHVQIQQPHDLTLSEASCSNRRKCTHAGNRVAVEFQRPNVPRDRDVSTIRAPEEHEHSFASCGLLEHDIESTSLESGECVNFHVVVLQVFLGLLYRIGLNIHDAFDFAINDVSRALKTRECRGKHDRICGVSPHQRTNGPGGCPFDC